MIPIACTGVSRTSCSLRRPESSSALRISTTASSMLVLPGHAASPSIRSCSNSNFPHCRKTLSQFCFITKRLFFSARGRRPTGSDRRAVLTVFGLVSLDGRHFSSDDLFSVFRLLEVPVSLPCSLDWLERCVLLCELGRGFPIEIVRLEQSNATLSRVSRASESDKRGACT